MTMMRTVLKKTATRRISSTSLVMRTTTPPWLSLHSDGTLKMTDLRLLEDTIITITITSHVVLEIHGPVVSPAVS